MQRANSLEKTLMLGKTERLRRGQQDEMVGGHHQLNGHESEQTLGDGKGQGNLACCSPWGLKESDMTEQLNNNNKALGWTGWISLQSKGLSRVFSNTTIRKHKFFEAYQPALWSNSHIHT